MPWKDILSLAGVLLIIFSAIRWIILEIKALQGEMNRGQKKEDETEKNKI